ncbi:unnamed protein product [Paramecium octaurelia]|uniref:Uncharacterized protein n=1 Tax=Paramecium octaurelia TaxID=43137 RepID=A0A8S1S876_PAROT|nr:unnamed protein product [Paramecium octaurelia]
MLIQIVISLAGLQIMGSIEIRWQLIFIHRYINKIIQLAQRFKNRRHYNIRKCENEFEITKASLELLFQCKIKIYFEF